MTATKTKPTAADPAIITINATYGFTVSDREYSLYKRVTVDPTKAPSYKPEPGVAHPEPYEDWRTINRYYSQTTDGLRSILLYVTHRSVNDSFSGSSVTEYMAAIQAELSRLNAMISSALIPAVFD
ncbi:hypothetical protein D3P07_00930 [Paenibacillus sp. 1011MAR3C5]|uniref:hypothetical protein n=1 Tax=Paenibacillus sp. 1011MAR3C5 TaxID=1675787 RepID=UPI000E6C0726|nr:hypothetical protein [Paenibacillus sp. 1011MAR3C5]RJE90702.1 hypothetical protein D3P07_00930 [Paenibacillus sp. 1011MAR3C5]